jgi:hypothetical protein
VGPAADRFFAGFYRDPDPKLAAAALAEYLASPRPNVDSVMRMFCSAARRSPEVAAAFRALGEQSPDLADTVRSVLTVAADPTFPDAMTMPLAQPGDLDFLWGEFLLSGSPDVVRRIAATLEREDRLLAGLEAWLRHPPLLSFFTRPRLLKRLADVGIATDPDRPRLGNAMDVDLHVWKLMSGGFKLRDEMPFAIPDELVAHLAVKGSACWSLQSNAMQHDVVREVYERQPNRDRWPTFVGSGQTPPN